MNVRNLSLAMFAVSIIAGGIAFLITGSSRVAVGVPAGAIIGIVTVATWGWLLGRLQDRYGVLLFALITVGKLAFYAGAFYILIGRGLVNPFALAGGLTGTVMALLVFIHLKDGARTGIPA